MPFRSGNGARRGVSSSRNRVEQPLAEFLVAHDRALGGNEALLKALGHPDDLLRIPGKQPFKPLVNLRLLGLDVLHSVRWQTLGDFESTGPDKSSLRNAGHHHSAK